MAKLGAGFFVGLGQSTIGSLAGAFDKSKYKSEWHYKTEQLKQLQNGLKNGTIQLPNNPETSNEFQKMPNNKPKIIIISITILMLLTALIINIKKSQ